MPVPRTEDQWAAADAGFFGHLSGYLAALAAYLKARLQLAGLEAKDAAVHYAIIIALLIGSLIIVVFGYIFLCMAIVFAIAALFESRHAWIGVTFGMALLHFGGAVALVFLAKSRFSAPMFTETLNEFHKDQQWLNSTTAKLR